MEKSSARLFFQYDHNKTPLQNAMNRIKNSYIAAFISAGITLVFTFLAFMGQNNIATVNAYTIIDVVFVIVLALLIMLIKSRVASIVLFVYFLFSKIVMFIEDPASGIFSLFLALIFAIAYFYGITGTFSYHKIKKQEKMNSTTPK